MKRNMPKADGRETPIVSIVVNSLSEGCDSHEAPEPESDKDALKMGCENDLKMRGQKVKLFMREPLVALYL